MRFRMVMIVHPGPGTGLHKWFMWWIIIPPTTLGPGGDSIGSSHKDKPKERHALKVSCLLFVTCLGPLQCYLCRACQLLAAKVLFVKKKDGSLCLCIDFCTLNRVTEKDHYPLPLIPDLLNSLGPARIYSKINLKHAYHLVWIMEGDEPRTAFHMCYGSYEWWVMPFGLTNTPAVFQWFINKVLGNLLDICTVGYIDNILIYLDSID